MKSKLTNLWNIAIYYINYLSRSVILKKVCPRNQVQNQVPTFFLVREAVSLRCHSREEKVNFYVTKWHRSIELGRPWYGSSFFSQENAKNIF